MIRWVSSRDYEGRLSPSLWMVVLTGFAVALAPLLWHIGGVLALVLLCGVAVKWLSLRRGQMWLSWVGIAAFTPLSLALVFMNFRTQGFTLTFLQVLAVMAIAKVLEARNSRDARVIFLLDLVLMLAFLMYSQSILMFLYLLVALWTAVWALMKTEQRGLRRAHFGRPRDVARLLLLALPFAVLMFFFFPRIQPLWGMPQHSNQSVTGLPEEMQMDDIASLATSDEVTFRARFSGAVPPSRALYWRGPVLWHYDGRNWRQRIQDGATPPQVEVDSESVVHYSIVPEKNDLQWLLALDVPTSLPGNMQRGYAMQVRLPPRKGAARYQLASAMNYRLEGLSRRDLNDALRLPDGFDAPRTRALAEELFVAGGREAGGFARAFLAYLNREEFYYSLEPPPGMGNVDEFLFRGRIGFCEHYANAMALAARTVGIPSRVVIGYQGGEVNPLNGEVVVREELAHAWVELYEHGKGWVRHDPTAAVAPNRIELARLSAETLSSGEDSRSFTSRMVEKLEAFAWMRNAVDAAQSFWRNWVIDLDGDQQDSLLGKLGLRHLGSLALILVMTVGLLILAVLLYWWWQKRPRADQDALARAAQALLKRFEKAGQVRYGHESVAMFLRRMAEGTRQAEAQRLLQAAKAYEQVRYQENGNSAFLIGFLKRIRP